MQPYEAEQLTRSKRIDPRLNAAGWSVAPTSEFDEAIKLSGVAVRELPTLNGPADYALCDDHRIQAVVEAKKVTLGPQAVLTQAERYSRGLAQYPLYQDEFAVPFLYSTNGEVIWFRDVRSALNRSRVVSGLHTPAALREMATRNFDHEMKVLSTLPGNDYLRPYQREANVAIEEAIRARKRKMLVTMATGTGKTVTMVNQVYRLMKSGVARRSPGRAGRMPEWRPGPAAHEAVHRPPGRARRRRGRGTA